MNRAIRSTALLILLAVSVAAADWDRGVSFYKKADYDRALAEFQDIVGERPDAAGAWYYIGLCQFKLKRYNRVELPLSHAIELLEIQSPSSRDIEGAWYTIGFAHYLLKEYETALKPLARYIEVAVSARREVDPSARRALGRSYFFLERYDEAAPLLAATSRAADQGKEGGVDFYYLGAMYFKHEDDDRAAAALREAVKVNSEDAASWELLANSLLRKAGKVDSKPAWAEAVAAGERLVALRDDLRSADILGRACMGARQFDKAVAPLEKIAKANPSDGQAWLYYGIALSRSGRMRRAMEALEMTIQMIPGSIPALAELAYVYESDKQYQQALRIYEKALAAGGSNELAIQQSIGRVKALMSQPR